MASANFIYQDVLDAVRTQIGDESQRRWPDATILSRTIPRALSQLRSDRPDIWHGVYGTENFKPTAVTACPFDDVGFDALVQAVVSLLNEQSEEAGSDGLAVLADMKSERNRTGGNRG